MLQHSLSRTELLIGKDALDKLAKSKVMVFGVGGVGSFTVEALARAGVGNLILVDDDTVCLTNLNRQIHATYKTISKNKVEVMKERVLSVNRNCNVETIQVFVTPDNLEEIISLDEDLSIPDNFYSGSYLEEEIHNLFPDDTMSAEVLKIYETN